MMQSNQYHGIGLNTQSNFAIIGSNQPSQLSNMSDARGALKPLGHQLNGTTLELERPDKQGSQMY